MGRKSIMKKLLSDTLGLCKDLALLRADRAVYVLLTVSNAAALVVGLVVGHCAAL